MDADIDAMLKGLIARTAVTEQMMLVLLAATAREYEHPTRFAAAMIAEARERFADIGPEHGPGAEQFRDAALAVLDEVERRALMLVGPGPADA